MNRLIVAAAALALTGPAFAQDDAITIEVAESEEFGQYLTDGAGQPVYFFSADTRASADQRARTSCTDPECLDAWPPVATSGDPRAGEGADAALLGTMEHDGQPVVTYNGWPLYRSASDETQPEGHGTEAFGGVWRLLTPQAQAQATDLDAGDAIYQAECAQCHGPAAGGMASFPSIAGNNAHYIASRLMQYRAGETIGSNSALMRPVAAKLSDEDIANIAAFIAKTFQ